MTLEDGAALGEILTSIATVATLFYLAVQIRDANKLQVNESRRAVHHTTRDISAIIGQSTETARIFRLGVNDPTALNEDQQVQFDWIFGLVLGQALDSYEEMSAGFGREEYFEQFFTSTFAMVRAPGGRDFWKRHKRTYSKGFREYVDRKVLG